MTDEPAGLPKLTVKDHTRIIELVIKNRSQLKLPHGQKSSAKVLRRIVELEPSEKAFVEQIAAAVSASRRAVAKLPPGHPLAREAISTFVKTATAGDVTEMVTRLRVEENESHAQEIAIGIKTARRILDDGADTIYSPEVWIVAQVMPDPNVNWTNLRGGLTRVADAVKAGADKAASVAGADVAGAIEGAVSGFAEGGAEGAAAGAVGHAIEASIESAAE